MLATVRVTIPARCPTERQDSETRTDALSDCLREVHRHGSRARLSIDTAVLIADRRHARLPTCLVRER